MNIKEIQAKSLLRKYKKIDSWFISRYGMNPYRGCLHNCAYCDGRYPKYNVEGDFGKEVSVKTNAVQLLEKELSPKGKRKPLKKTYILTKLVLVERDLKLIIGTQEWMAEDLKVTHHPNGDLIPHVTDYTAWDNLANNNTDDAYCFYNNNSGTDYGALYTYAAAIGDDWARDNSDGQGVCPDGWHLPTDAEWTTLTDELGGTGVAGGKMKETGTTHWNSPNTGATNESGFTALPDGDRRHYDGHFLYQGKNGRFCSATEDNATFAWPRGLCYNYGSVSRGSSYKSCGQSVRCLRD